MIKRFCDYGGCDREAVTTITAPRNVVKYAKDGHGNVLHKIHATEQKETDLCSFHAQMIANDLYIIDGEENGN